MSDRATPAGTGRSTLVMARRTDADGSVWRAVHLMGDGSASSSTTESRAPSGADAGIERAASSASSWSARAPAVA